MNQGSDAINKAIKILKDGGIVIFPTDTVYGIGCRLDNEICIKRLYKIRNRPEEKAVLAVVDSVEMAEKYVKIDKNVKEKLIDKYWPGALTIVLPCDVKLVPSIARGGGVALAIRQTKNPVLLDLIRTLGVPIIAPSANFAGDPAPGTFTEINKKLLALVDYAINLPSEGSIASTIIDCTKDPWRILRQGGIKIKL